MAERQGKRLLVGACIIGFAGVLGLVIALVIAERQRRPDVQSRLVLLQTKTTPDVARGRSFSAWPVADGFVVQEGWRVTFLDRDGQLRSRRDLPPDSYVSVSPGGTYVGWCEAAKYDECKACASGPGTTRVFSSQGNELWSIVTKDVAQPRFLGDSGKLLGLAVTGEGEFVSFPILGPKGVEKMLPAPWMGSMSTAVAVPQKGTHFALMDGQPPAVMLYDDKGTRLYRTVLEGRPWGLRVVYCPGDAMPSVLAMTQIDQEPAHYLVWRLDGAGKIAWSVRGRYRGNRHIDVSNDRRYFTTYSTGDRIECYEITTGNLRWRWDEGVRNRAVLQTVFSPDDRYLAASASWNDWWDNPEHPRMDGPRKVLLFDAANGTLLWELAVDGKGYHGWERSPLVRFRGPDTLEVLDIPGGRMSVYRIKG